jgi:DNA-binding GntR family transcriptional regulator
MMTLAEATGAGKRAAESMADYAYRILRDQLVLLDIAPGTPLAESRLAPDLGVGRTPLREALKRLESDHLVTTFARRGTFASSIDITELAQITEMRQVLFPFAVRRAAELDGGAARQDLAEVLDLLPGIGASNDPRELLECDLRIHRHLSLAARNTHLEESLVRLDNLATRVWCVMLDRIPPMGEHVQEHAALLRAVLDGDPERAEELALAHVRRFDRVVRSAL